MAKIIYLMGKSSSGKDTIYKQLMEQKKISLCQVVMYTTRPIRDGEKEGVEYHFTDEAQFQQLKAEGLVIEDRAYDTVQGLWRYYTVLDKQLEETGSEKTFLMIGTLESYNMTRKVLGDERMIPIYIDLDDGERLQRALDRERGQEKPQYEEMCRRFLADAKDFSEEKIKEAGIQKRFLNQDLNECLSEIMQYIASEI